MFYPAAAPRVSEGASPQKQLDDYLNSEFVRADRYGNTFSLVFGRLAQYRRLSARYGSRAALNVATEVARRIESNIRTCDRSFRYSDSEYLILLPNTASQGATQTAMKLKHIIEESPVVTGSGAVVVPEFSYGITMFPLQTRVSLPGSRRKELR